MRQPLAGLLAAWVLLAGCSSSDDVATLPASPPVATLVDGTLTACVAEGPGLATSADGGFAGYDVAVLTAVAEELGLGIEIVSSDLDAVVSGVALNGGTCDVAAAGVVDRPVLDTVVTTSVPYRAVHRQLVGTTPGPEVDPTTVTGSVGYEEGGAAAGEADALPAAEVVAFPSRADLGRALDQGAVELALVTVVDRARLEEQLGAGLVLRGLVPTDETTVLLLPLGAPEDLTDPVDGALAALTASGELEQLAEAWLRD